MGWFEEELNNLKKKMKWGFRDLGLPEDGDVLTPLANIKEGKNEVVAKFKVPGVSRKDISVKLTSEGIEVCAERFKHIEVKKQGHYRSEKSHIKYYRNLPLPAMLDHGNAKIDFDNGILKVRIPKIKRMMKFKLKKK